METQEVIKSWVDNYLVGEPSLFCIDIKIKGTYGSQKVTITIDGDPGVSIDQLSQLSRKLGAHLEEINLLDGKYTLEVTSPGIDQPLLLVRQYKKNAGREVKIILTDGLEVTGKLKSASDEAVVVVESKSKKEIEISFSNIVKTNIVVSFK